jgi:hypothetical protein
VRIGQTHKDPTAVVSVLYRFKDSVVGVLDDFKNLAVAVAAREHGLFSVKGVLG